MAHALSIIWARLLHDLGLYEHEFTLDEVVRTHHPFTPEDETPEEREERLHTEVGGLSVGSQL